MECKVKDLLINYEVIGNGKPIIMLHGTHVDHRLMKGCMEPVFKSNDQYKRIYIDLPGMGKTKSAEWIINSDIMLEILIEFIDKIIPNENFLLAGESYGGYLSRGIVNKIGDRVDGLLLLCPVIIADHKKRNVPKHIVLKSDKDLLSELTASEAKDFNEIQVVQSKEIWLRYREEILSGVRLADYDFLDNLQQEGYSFSFDVDALKEPFDKPALIVLGRQDSCVGFEDAWSILSKYPRATFAVIDKAGHNLQIEQPELFNSLASEWLLRASEA
ncbi:hydrolase, alpha/beta domain protein [Clostridiales bacterium oral taxon 876 str. F0540]|nr:hydrolase, alpha/beta domain protein [Clostridiales bacterium oral taxon 876 str. F0540]